MPFCEKLSAPFPCKNMHSRLTGDLNGPQIVGEAGLMVRTLMVSRRVPTDEGRAA